MPTFFFHSGMTGAPTNTNAAGSTLGIIRACLVEGFNVLTPSSASVTSEVMTITYSSAHGYENLVWIRLDGAAGGSIVKRATVTSSTTLTIEAPGFADGAVAGTLSTRVAPADWEEVFTGTLKAVFRSKVEGPGSTRFFYRVSDSGTGNPYRLVRGFESMTDVDTGIGPFPTVTQETGDGVSLTMSRGSAGQWVVVCDARTFYFCPRYEWSVGSFFGSVLRFGDEAAMSAADVFCAGVGGGEGQLTDAGQYYRPRNPENTGTSVASGGGIFPIASLHEYPSTVDGGMLFFRPVLLRTLGAGTPFRGVARGALSVSSNPIPSNAIHLVMDDVDGVQGRVVVVRTSIQNNPRAVAFAVDEEWA